RSAGSAPPAAIMPTGITSSQPFQGSRAACDEEPDPQLHVLQVVDRLAAGPGYHGSVGSIPGTPQLARNVKRVSRLELPGAGQIYVAGKYAYVGHITNRQQFGTSILDVSDARHPKLLSQI